MKIIFMGTPAFAVPSLQALLDSAHEVIAVYTQPPRPAGRGHKETKSPVHVLAEAHHIPIYTPENFKMQESVETFAALNADIAVVAAYGLLLPKAILEACPHGCINVHPSLLPRWRGAAPIQRTIMAGDTKTGVCIMQMNEGLDTGDVLSVAYSTIPDGTTSGALHDHFTHMSATLLLTTLENIENGTAIPVAQSEDGATYAKKISKEECRIDWTKPAKDIRQHILGLNPSPGAYFDYEGEKIKILEADINAFGHTLTPGLVINATLEIACGKGVLIPTMLQRSGKKAMPREEFLRGFLIPSGTVLK